MPSPQGPEQYVFHVSTGFRLFALSSMLVEAQPVSGRQLPPPCVLLAARWRSRRRWRATPGSNTSRGVLRVPAATRCCRDRRPDSKPHHRPWNRSDSNDLALCTARPSSPLSLLAAAAASCALAFLILAAPPSAHAAAALTQAQESQAASVSTSISDKEVHNSLSTQLSPSLTHACCAHDAVVPRGVAAGGR
jgi:hypothetical protein